MNGFEVNGYLLVDSIPGETHYVPPGPKAHDLIHALCPCDPEIRVFTVNKLVIIHKSPEQP